MKNFEDKLIFGEFYGLTYIEYVYIISYLIMFFKVDKSFRKALLLGITFPVFIKLFEKFIKRTNKNLAKTLNIWRPVVSSLYLAGVLQTIFEEKAWNITSPTITPEQRREAETRINARKQMSEKLREYLPRFVHGLVLEDLKRSWGTTIEYSTQQEFYDKMLSILALNGNAIPLYEMIRKAELSNSRHDWELVAFLFYVYLGGDLNLSRIFVTTDIDPNLVTENPNTPSRYNETNCSICLEPLTNFVESKKCGHRFHKECARKWKSIQKTCPLCKQTDVFFRKTYLKLKMFEKFCDGYSNNYLHKI